MQSARCDALYKPVPDDDEILRTYPHLPIWLIKQLIGRAIVLGTPQTEETIYSILQRKGYARRIWPARYPDQRWMENHGSDLAPKIAEELEREPSLSTGWGEDGKQGKPTDTRFGDHGSLRAGCQLWSKWVCTPVHARHHPVGQRPLPAEDS